MNSFEVGPIRPPSEAQSILLRLTRNCPWNRCAFCPVYKGERFSPRSTDEVIHDIDVIASIADMLNKKMTERFGNADDPTRVLHVLKAVVEESGHEEHDVRQVAFWVYHGLKSVFLQDADSLVLKTDRIVTILNHLKKKFPQTVRITSYARAQTLSRKSLDELISIHEAGLTRIHIGMESGCNEVLDLVNKGVTQEEQIRAGQNVIKAGFELSEYFMPGLGGKDLSSKHARDSASTLNQINPTYIRLRSVIPVPGTPLFDLYQSKKWVPLTETEKVSEIRLFIELLEGIGSTVKSDHIMNLLENAEGTLPEGKASILGVLDSFLTMDEDIKESFIIGRRIGRYRDPLDMPYIREIDMLKYEMKKQYRTVDEAVLELLWNYI